jgi:NAD(P)-dependent dehydrogenase (short-subunit alcohol dehydrogenase family)
MPENSLMLKENALQGKTIVVTGGGTGLGYAMSKGFAQLGANVVITSRKEEVIEKSAQELRDATGGELLPIPCDIRAYEEIEEMLQRVEEAYEIPDVLVNNAAGNFISPTERLSPNAFKAVIDTVLMGSINCTLALGKRWIDEGVKDRNVLNITTTYAWTGSAYVTPSACGKAGVLAMTRSLAVEWAKYGIRLNAIAPGPFPTEGAWERLLPGKWAKEFDMKDEVPLGRVGEHEELTNLATYLVSDYAGFINGEVVTIDGGEWLKDAGQFNMFQKLSDSDWDELQAHVMGKKKG